MPAPNIPYLLNIEGNYETALRNYFANVNYGGSTFTQVVTPRTNLTTAEFLQTPRLQIRCSVAGVLPTGGGLTEGQYTFNNVSQNYWSAYMVQAEFTVATQRSNSDQLHGMLRGGVRQSMLAATAIMNNTVLPYYQTADVVPLTSSQGIDPDNDEINTLMTYEFTVFVPPSSFPNS